MIELARANAPGIRFDVGTIDDLEDKFDIVLALNILRLVEDVEHVLSRVDGLLNPGGRFVSVTTCMNANLILRIAGVFARLAGAVTAAGFTPSELVDMITRRFEIAETKQFERHHILVAARKAET